MKITVVGLGYVGLANALLLAQRNTVTGVDVNQERIALLNSGNSPLQDQVVEKALRDTKVAWSSSLESIAESELLIIATPTNYDEVSGQFDTSSIEDVASKAFGFNKDINILIKSTIPIGYVSTLRQKLKTDNIAFSPEFLREGKALHDNLYPSRIIVGEKTEWASRVANLFAEAALNTPEIILTGPEEAESIKLFSNTYLAMRVAYFNELDNFCIEHGLNAKDVILGTSLDPRIGNFYNNPSFGYGGYCLPKDTKQLLANYDKIPNELISAIVRSNSTRKSYIVNDILKMRPKTVGIYRLAMKAGSDNFRMSSILDIMEKLRESGVEVIIFEPNISESTYLDFRIVNFDELTASSD